MKRQYRSIINWLRAAIKNEDTVTAVEVAKQLLPGGCPSGKTDPGLSRKQIFHE